MFSTFGGFFALYIPLVILAVIGVWKEERLIAFERRLKEEIGEVFRNKFATKTDH